MDLYRASLSYTSQTSSFANSILSCALQSVEVEKIDVARMATQILSESDVSDRGAVVAGATISFEKNGLDESFVKDFVLSKYVFFFYILTRGCSELSS